MDPSSITMSHEERPGVARDREIWRNLAALERNSIGRVEDRYATAGPSPRQRRREHREHRRHHRRNSRNRGAGSLHVPGQQTSGSPFPRGSTRSRSQSRGAQPADVYTDESLPDEPPPSYEDSQAQAQARTQEAENSFQNLSLQGHSQHQRSFSNNLFNDTNSSQHNRSTQSHQHRRSPNSRSPVNGPLAGSAQPTSALLEHALRFMGPNTVKPSSSSFSRLPRPILIPSTPTGSSSPHCFPILSPPTLHSVPAQVFSSFLTNLNILLSLSAADPFPADTMSEPLVHAYMSRVNHLVFHPFHFHISLVPTQNLAPTLFQRDPSYIETSRTFRAQSAILAHKRVTSLEPWVEIVDPYHSSLSSSSSSAAKERSNGSTTEMLRLRDEVIAERKAARHLASEFLGSSAPGAASHAALQTPPAAFNTWTEWNTGDREVDHVFESPGPSSHSKSKSPYRDNDDASSISSTSSSSSFSSATSASDEERGKQRDRKFERKRTKWAAKFQRKLEKIEHKAEKEMRKGKKGSETVRREREEAEERLERRRMRKEARRGKRAERRGRDRESGGAETVDRVENEPSEEKGVLWLVIQNNKMRQHERRGNSAAALPNSEYPTEKN